MKSREIVPPVPILLLPRGTQPRGDERTVSFPMSLEQMFLIRWGAPCLEAVSRANQKDVAKRILVIDAMHLELPLLEPNPIPGKPPIIKRPSLTLMDRKALLVYSLWQKMGGDKIKDIARVLKESNPEDIKHYCQRVLDNQALIDVYEEIEQFHSALISTFSDTRDVKQWRVEIEEFLRLKTLGFSDDEILSRKEEIRRHAYNKYRLIAHESRKPIASAFIVTPRI
jgi:hypothetical protein